MHSSVGFAGTGVGGAKTCVRSPAAGTVVGKRQEGVRVSQREEGRQAGRK